MTSSIGSRFSTNFSAIGASTWGRAGTFFTVSPRWSRFRQAVGGQVDRQLLDVSWRVVESPANSPEVIAHVRRYRPEWTGFRSRVYTYLTQEWNPIYQTLETPTGGAELQEEVAPLGQRDMLAQVFEACPEGSYGYYAQWGLAPFRMVAGNVAAATIHEFFASQIQFLMQPMSPEVTEIMSSLETRYWESREDIIDYVAGKVLTKRTRGWAVVTPATLRRLWEGERMPTLAPGETLSQEQLAEIAAQLNAKLGELDAAAARKFAQELFEKMAAENRLRIGEHKERDSQLS
jgi:hypothetical protein